MIRKLLPTSLCAIVALLVGAASSPAAFPGKPGPIAYSKTSTDETGEGTLERLGGLFAKGPARGPARQLTLDPDDRSPSYSADGRSIVFAGDEEGPQSAIYVFGCDGSDRTLVTSDGADPHFFPGGRAIVFVRRVGGHSHLFTIRLDGSGLRQLTDGPYDDSEPAVSRDGRRIAFTTDRDPDGRRDRSDVFVMSSDGTGMRVLLDGPYNEYEPDFAPSGRRLAFGSNRGRGAGVFVARANGSGVSRLTPCNPFPPRCRGYFNPAFSPDGKHIAVLGLGRRSSTLSIIRSDGRGVSTTIDDGGTEEEGFGSHVGPPAWGPVQLGIVSRANLPFASSGSPSG